MAALLDGLTADAAAAGVGSVYTAAMIPETASETTLLETHGWTVASRNEFFEGPLEGVGTRFDAAYQRLAETPEGDITVGRVRPGLLTPDVLPAVHALVTSKGLVPPDELAHRLSRLDTPGGYSRLGSSVLLTLDAIPAVAAVVLMRLDASTAEFDARIADPRVCAAAGISVPLANLLLLRDCVRQLRAAGGGASGSARTRKTTGKPRTSPGVAARGRWAHHARGATRRETESEPRRVEFGCVNRHLQ